jgi:hypothetical protein
MTFLHIIITVWIECEEVLLIIVLCCVLDGDNRL